MTRKILVGLALSIVLVLLLGGVAYAAQGDSTYLTNPSGENPHRGYDVNTKKCAVCHAVHHAGTDGQGGGGSEALLRSDRGNACSYCHINPGVSSKIVYGGDANNYNVSDTPFGHNNAGSGGVACVSCHQVHAAAAQMTPNAALSEKLLVALPAGFPYDLDADNFGPDLGGPIASDSKDLAVTKWCGRCHTYWPGSDPDTVDSHILTSTLSSTAYVSSAFCVSCHNSNTVGGVVTTASAFPHFTDGARFLTSAATSLSGNAVPLSAAADSQYDGVCLRCHRDGAGNGVGITF
jgi:hypothetical protein